MLSKINISFIVDIQQELELLEMDLNINIDYFNWSSSNSQEAIAQNTLANQANCSFR